MSAIAFVIFNRPDKTRRVFAEIRRARPPQLLVIADGPRKSRPGESEKCAATRAVVSQIDWPCHVETNFSDVNLGCRRRLATGLDWVFSRVSEAIILEDDCLPHPDFFRFCNDMLDRYRDCPRVMHITGTNFRANRPHEDASYYFSRYVNVWGWATWRRAWKEYDVNMSRWNDLRRSGWLERQLAAPNAVRYWRDVFDRTALGLVDTWDYQWMFACWASDGLAVVPRENLISNIGFDEAGTHTTGGSKYANLAVKPLVQPLQHPADIAADLDADSTTERENFSGNWSWPAYYQRRLRLLARPLLSRFGLVRARNEI